MRKIRVNGDALHAVFGRDKLDFAQGGHFLVRINPPEPHKFLGIGPAEFQYAGVVGRETIGGFAVAPGDDPHLHIKPVKVCHNVFKRLGLAPVKAYGLARRLEHGTVLDAVDDLGSVRAKTKIYHLHFQFSPRVEVISTVLRHGPWLSWVSGLQEAFGLRVVQF